MDLGLFQQFGKASITPASSKYWGYVLVLADAMTGKVRQAFLDAVALVVDVVDWREFEKAMADGQRSKALEVLNLERNLNLALKGGFASALVQVLLAAGTQSAKQAVMRVPTRMAAVASFDVTNPATLQFLENYRAGLITNVSKETATAVADVVRNSVVDGTGPRATARTVKTLVGLLPKQAAQVQKYREQLTNEGRPQVQIDRMVERLAKRKLNERADMIARTETLRASNAGNQLSWKQLQADGLLPPDQRHQWVVTPDDRLCPDCAAIPGMNKQGRAVGEPFESPLGPVTFPPLHPHCRCTTVLMVTPA